MQQLLQYRYFLSAHMGPWHFIIVDVSLVSYVSKSAATGMPQQDMKRDAMHLLLMQLM